MKIRKINVKKPVAKLPSSRKIIRKMKENYLRQKSVPRRDIDPTNITSNQSFFLFSGKGGYPGYVPPGAQKPGEGGEGEPTKEIVAIKEAGIDITIPKSPTLLESPMSSEEKDMLKNIKLMYPLIPSKPKKNEKVFAYARIRWDQKMNSLVYQVVEPYIAPEDYKSVEAVKRELEEKLDVDFFKLGEIKAKELVMEEVGRIIASMHIDRSKRETLSYYIQRDIIGLGRIEPLMRDHDIEDISCDGQGIPIYIYHRNPMLGSMITNIMFRDSDELDSFVMKLAQKCSKSLSVAEPLVDGALPDGSRVQATLGTDIARRGSNFTVRKFTAMPLTPVHMLEYGTLDSTQMAYLWLAIENRKSVLISGGTATGKTSLLNALSLFIKPSLKIVSIEDTPELRLPHPHWIPEVARTPVSISEKAGEVSLFDLLKESLRQRPDYIIVGEVRGKETYVLFQQIATGHAGLATIHAASLPQLIDRLTTPPISLPPTLLENIDIILFLTQVKIKDKYVRRMNEIIEIKGMKGDRPATEAIFKWKPVQDVFEPVGKSVLMENISNMLGFTEKSIRDELTVRKSILEWMRERKIYDYRDVARIINGYYSDPDRIINLVQGM
ncbi:MAG: type II/IV secretion system ATPase subunit [Candidatus Aenigmarchaeota archaeon]|nr:type II/IV secretion system ATPase subunit [Candidatus Aenigmarchaeota archaeon]